MKTKLITGILWIISLSLTAQTGINYKAIIKDSDGNVLVNQNVDLQFIIYEGAALTNSAYEEGHTAVMTDNNGLVNVTIGEGASTGELNDVTWGNDEHFLNVQVNIGSGLIDLGTTQFQSVPYAFNASMAQEAPVIASVIYPSYQEVSSMDYQLLQDGSIRFDIRFNIRMQPSTFVYGDSITITGSGGAATVPILIWLDGNTRLVMVTVETFDELSPCASGGIDLLIKGNGSSRCLDINNRPIDGDKDGYTGGDFSVNFDKQC